MIQSCFLHSRHTLVFCHLEQFSSSSGWYFVSLFCHEILFLLCRVRRMMLRTFHGILFSLIALAPVLNQGKDWLRLMLKWPFFNASSVCFCHFSACISLLWERTGAAHQDRPQRICSELILRAVDKTSGELVSAPDTGEVVSLS